jgi:hypothetical protein
MCRASAQGTSVASYAIGSSATHLVNRRWSSRFRAFAKSGLALAGECRPVVARSTLRERELRARAIS